MLAPVSVIAPSCQLTLFLNITRSDVYVFLKSPPVIDLYFPVVNIKPCRSFLALWLFSFKLLLPHPHPQYTSSVLTPSSSIGPITQHLLGSSKIKASRKGKPQSLLPWMCGLNHPTLKTCHNMSYCETRGKYVRKLRPAAGTLRRIDLCMSEFAFYDYTYLSAEQNVRLITPLTFAGTIFWQPSSVFFNFLFVICMAIHLKKKIYMALFEGFDVFGSEVKFNITQNTTPDLYLGFGRGYIEFSNCISKAQHTYPSQCTYKPGISPPPWNPGAFHYHLFFFFNQSTVWCCKMNSQNTSVLLFECLPSPPPPSLNTATSQDSATSITSEYHKFCFFLKKRHDIEKKKECKNFWRRRQWSMCSVQGNGGIKNHRLCIRRVIFSLTSHPITNETRKKKVFKLPGTLAPRISTMIIQDNFKSEHFSILYIRESLNKWLLWEFLEECKGFFFGCYPRVWG
ncbi:hypothetical protein VP01_62g7 [Puccinia sorghi]|uniref:Uncharacterized protein n=1 Tax=Puccinia sorghi TaxID=27349 RepID=A0A0L6UH25_9BASI|nr:hypothetical protein VP01_62g7 [Puccinia sorghi]